MTMFQLDCTDLLQVNTENAGDRHYIHTQSSEVMHEMSRITGNP